MLHWLCIRIALLAGSLAQPSPCVLGTQADGYVIGEVVDVESVLDPEVGCTTRIKLHALRSSSEDDTVEVLMSGGFCDGPAVETVCPGGRRTFSFALPELAIVAFCKDGDDYWVIDKGTVWSEAYGRSPDELVRFLNDVKDNAGDIESLGVYHGFSPEVLGSPDGSKYSMQSASKTAWFLQQVRGSSPETKVGVFLAALGF